MTPEEFKRKAFEDVKKLSEEIREPLNKFMDNKEGGNNYKILIASRALNISFMEWYMQLSRSFSAIENNALPAAMEEMDVLDESV